MIQYFYFHQSILLLKCPYFYSSTQSELARVANLSPVSCTITQKNGAGVQVGSACFWDSTGDGTAPPPGGDITDDITGPSRRLIGPLSPPAGSCVLRWENRSLYCLVTVFGLGI